MAERMNIHDIYMASDSLQQQSDSTGIAEEDSIQDVPQDSLGFAEKTQADSSQVKPPAPVKVKQDSTWMKASFFSGFEICVDYGKLLMSFTDFESKYEGGINLRFKETIVLAAEYGQSTLDPIKAFDNTKYYTIEGSYFRAGAEYYRRLSQSFIYLGYRYGTSMFEDKGEFIMDSEFWEPYSGGFGSEDLKATWSELILGTESPVRLGKVKEEGPRKPDRLFLGAKIRLRILHDFENREDIRVFAIPGYGRSLDKTTPAVNLYLKYRIGR